MPAKMEGELKAESRKKGLKGEAFDRYVYGTMRKTGWKPKKRKSTNGNSKKKTQKAKR